MKTLINVDDRIWGKVKDYATVERLSLSSAVENLLKDALRELNVKSNQGAGAG
jgi:hypothetical protein